MKRFISTRASAIFKSELEAIKEAGTFKTERVISSAQKDVITVNSKQVINFCANNYLGLSSHPQVIENSKKMLDNYGAGVSSVRFICGTQDIHKELEGKIAAFHAKQDAILYPSCFDANAGLFEALLNEQDAIISDTLNHASIIDGIRLCKAKRFRYIHNDLASIEECLQKADADNARIKLIATDGAFSKNFIISQAWMATLLRLIKSAIWLTSTMPSCL